MQKKFLKQQPQDVKQSIGLYSRLQEDSKSRHQKAIGVDQLKDFWMHPPVITHKKLVRDGSQDKLVDHPKVFSKGYTFNNPLFRKKYLNLDNFLNSGGKVKDIFSSKIEGDLLSLAVDIFKSQY